MAKPPIVKDTTLLEEEIVNVEVWTYNEPQLYTVQELQLKNDLKKSYETVIHLNNDKLIQLATVEFPDAEIGNEGNAMFALVNTSLPYELESQWTQLRHEEGEIAFARQELAHVTKSTNSLRPEILDLGQAITEKQADIEFL